MEEEIKYCKEAYINREGDCSEMKVVDEVLRLCNDDCLIKRIKKIDLNKEGRQFISVDLI